LPPVGALHRLHDWTRKVSANPWLAVAIAAGVLLFAAWIGWAIHATSENGARAGLGVLVAWPALLFAVGFILLPFIWAFRVTRAARADAGSTAVSDGSRDSVGEETGGSSGPESAGPEVTEPG
jgi:TRAP-type C4-dicarboxylate transport system permease small subunit